MKRKVRVLVADDEPHIRSLISWILSSLGAEVLEAENGLAALQSFAHFKPDVVMLDVNMPHLDGVEVLRRMIAQAPDTLIIMLTAINASAVVEECIGAGAYNYLLKNTSAEELHSVLEEMWQSCLDDLKLT